MVVRRLWVLLLVLVVVGCGGGPEAQPSATSPPTATPSPSPSGPARIVATQEVADRQVDLTIDSPAVGAEVKVRLLLPKGYAKGDSKPRPVLYLLHGCCDTYVSWTRSTDIAELSADKDLLVVMPDGGPVGFYSDWLTGPAWERFHLTELPELLAAEYGAGEPRAIVGVSMGGLGALGYAARHPGMFRAAASFSGIVHTRLTPDTAQGYLGLVSSEGQDPYALWGDPEKNADVWREHNPYDLVDRLTGTRVYVACGNGEPGPLDADDASFDGIEGSLGRQNAALAKRLKGLQPKPTVDLYGPGTHSWVYWNRDLRKAWPLLTDALGR
jgi:S-formylglutathione hydrolase FrmB